MDEREKAQARLDAIEIGRLAGTLEAISRREEGETADIRMKRAMAFAAWDFDGRPDGDAHLSEFGLVRSKATPSLERAPFQSVRIAVQPDDGKLPKRRIGGGRHS